MSEPTSDAWTQIRYDYEHTDRLIADICAEHGISSNTLRDRVRRWRWTPRRAPIPREGPPAVARRLLPGDDHPPLEREGTGGLRPPSLCERTPMQSIGYGAMSEAKCEPGWGDLSAHESHPTPPAIALRAPAGDPPPPGEGVRDAAAVPQSAFAAHAETDPASIAPRLQSAVARVLPAIETVVARLAAEPLRPREMEQTARALGTLTRSLRELNTLLSQHPVGGTPYDDDLPQDIDAFRDEVARRIEAFVASRADENNDGEAAPAGS
jgi:hypothetical protein